MARVDYDNQESIVAALKGQDFLIVTLPAAGAPDLHSKLNRAAVAAGVPYIMPNSYGYNVDNTTLYAELPHGPAFTAARNEILELGGTFLAMSCGFWYEWSLALGQPWFGFDIKNRKVHFLDGGNTRISVSTWEQCGRALAALLSLPESGSSPSVSDWKNKQVVSTSFLVSQRDILNSLNRVLGTTDADWEFTHEDSEGRFKKGLEDMKKGELLGFVRALYARSMYPNDDGNLEKAPGTDNKILGLPQEDLDEATKRAVALVESGFNPFA